MALWQEQESTKAGPIPADIPTSERVEKENYHARNHNERDRERHLFCDGKSQRERAARPPARGRKQPKWLRKFDSTLGYPGEGPVTNGLYCPAQRWCAEARHLHRLRGRQLAGAARRKKEEEKDRPRKPQVFVECTATFAQCPEPDDHYHLGGMERESKRSEEREAATTPSVPLPVPEPSLKTKEESPQPAAPVALEVKPRRGASFIEDAKWNLAFPKVKNVVHGVTFGDFVPTVEPEPMETCSSGSIGPTPADCILPAPAVVPVAKCAAEWCPTVDRCILHRSENPPAEQKTERPGYCTVMDCCNAEPCKIHGERVVEEKDDAPPVVRQSTNPFVGDFCDPDMTATEQHAVDIGAARRYQNGAMTCVDFEVKLDWNNLPARQMPCTVPQNVIDAVEECAPKDCDHTGECFCEDVCEERHPRNDPRDPAPRPKRPLKDRLLQAFFPVAPPPLPPRPATATVLSRNRTESVPLFGHGADKTSKWRRWFATLPGFELDATFVIMDTNRCQQMLTYEQLFLDRLSFIQVFQTTQRRRVYALVYGLAGYTSYREAKVYTELLDMLRPHSAKLVQRKVISDDGKLNSNIIPATNELCHRLREEYSLFTDDNILIDTAMHFVQVQYLLALIQLQHTPPVATAPPFQRPAPRAKLGNTAGRTRVALPPVA